MGAQGRYRTDAQTHAYRRGAIMGLTMAEAFVIIAFILLFLLAAWRVQTEAENAIYRELSRDDLPQILEIAQNGQFDKVLEFQSDPDAWRLIDKDELIRVLDKAQDFPEETQRDLADLVEIVDPILLREILLETQRAPDNAALNERLASMGERFERARDREAELVSNLIERLGDEVRMIGGTIAGDGSIVLPEGVAFEAGRADIKPNMRAFLDVICEPWLDVLMRSPAPISGARIEGHASSEWGDFSLDLAFLRNLQLSQERAAGVLQTCLEIVRDPAVIRWAHRYISAVGYSSGRPVLDQGIEDAERSRRVVFSVDVDDSALLKDVERDITEGLRAGEMTNSP